MAKRYYQFSELHNAEIGTPIKPSGTMGRHHLKVISKTETTVTVTGYRNENETGYRSENVVVRKGGKLGYNGGDLWPIKPVEEMTPIQRLKNDWKLKNVFIVTEEDAGKLQLEGLICSNHWGDVRPKGHYNLTYNGTVWHYRGQYCAISKGYHNLSGCNPREWIEAAYIVKGHEKEAIADIRENIGKRNFGYTDDRHANTPFIIDTKIYDTKSEALADIN